MRGAHRDPSTPIRDCGRGDSAELRKSESYERVQAPAAASTNGCLPGWRTPASRGTRTRFLVR